MQRDHPILVGQSRGPSISQQGHDLRHLIFTTIVVALTLIPEQYPVATNHPTFAGSTSSTSLATPDLTPKEGKMKRGPEALVLRHLAPWICLAEQPQHLQRGTIRNTVMEWDPAIAVLPAGHLLLA